MSDAPRLACTLDPAQMPQRGDDVRTLGRDGLLSVTRGGRQAILRFRRDPAIHRRVERIVAAESECCTFLAFTILDDEDATVVTMDALEGGELAMHGLAYLFTADTEVRA